MKRHALVMATALIVLVSTSTVTVAGSPADTIAARQTNFKSLSKAFKGIIDQTKLPTADIAVIQANANALAVAATKVGAGFPIGTGPDSGARTHALPAIWERPADFNTAASKLVNGSKAMQAAAASGNIELIKAAIPAVGGSCKGCHEQFKARD